MAHPEPAHDVGQDLRVSVEQPAEDTLAAVVHPEPAHYVGQGLKRSVGQPAEDAHATVDHPEPSHDVGEDLKVSVEQPAELAQIHNHLHGQVISPMKRLVELIGGVQLALPSAELAQNHDHIHSPMVERHMGQTPAAEVA